MEDMKTVELNEESIMAQHRKYSPVISAVSRYKHGICLE